MIELHLVRHGAVDTAGRVYGARLDPSLSSIGRAEVDRLRQRIDGSTGGMRLVRSPASRAAETLTRLDVGSARVDERWSERDLGTGEGSSWADFWAMAPPDVTTDPAAYVAWTPPEGEAVTALRTRVVEALEELTTGDDVAPSTLVVTHSGPIVCAVAHVLALDDATATRIHVGTATITTLRRYDEGSWTVRAVGR